MAVDKRSTRLGVLGLVAVLMLGAVGTRLWFLQGTQQSTYQAKVSAAKTRTVYVAPERGRIFDSQGRILADNKKSLTVAVDWSVIAKRSNRDALFTRLSGPLQTPVDDLQRRFDPCYGSPAIPKCRKGQIYSTLLPLPLKEDVSESDVNFILERSEDFPGVTVQEDWKRVYPYAPLSSHVIGYLGSITADGLKDYTARGYNPNERVGQFGVEQTMEKELHGTWGKRVFEIDAAGSIVNEDFDQEVQPMAGQDVQLTIDLNLQQFAEQALETELRNQRNLPDGPSQRNGGVPGGGLRAHNGIDPTTKGTTRIYASSKEFGTTEWVPFKAPAGAVVVENYTNGQIVAMASYPTFDNRWQGSGISGDKYKQLFPVTDDPDKSVLVNRAVQGQYNAGSSIKPFVAWSAMTTGLITANTNFMDTGSYRLTPQAIDQSRCQDNGGTARCVFKNASNASGVPAQYGPVTVESALAVSSDAFFYRLGEQFFLADNTPDHSLFKSDMSRFGFGSKSGIQLPYEFAGRIPDDNVKKALIDTGKFGKNEVPKLVVGDNVQVAIGQGLMAASPLQLVNAYATLANGGSLMQPTIIKNIYAPLTPNSTPGMADLAKGTVVKSFETPTVTDHLPMPEEIRGPIVRGLHRVVYGRGTFYPKCCPGFYHNTTGEYLFAGYNGVQIGGKTGTAQGAGNYPWNDSSAFGSFSTDGSQPFAVYAYLEKAGYGASAAAPVVKCMWTALSGKTPLDPVLISDPLDSTSMVPAPPKKLADPSCLGAANSTIHD
ncbi:MAG: penicillin-binding transpeptidase domain-containing protein [Ilumatobacteraceae bacterium]